MKATQKYIRMSPRKVRLVVDAIRDLKPNEALEQLAFMSKAAAEPVAKTIKQAMANATKNTDAKENTLRFKSIQIGEGSTYKRWQAVSRGRAHSILKRTSHIMIELKSIEDVGVQKQAKQVKKKKEAAKRK